MASKKDKGKGKAAVGASSAPTYILDVLPTPIVTFDIGDIDNIVENYEKCVKDIISIMENDTDVKYTFVTNGNTKVVPVTPGENDTPSGAYVIQLINGDKSLSLVATKYQTWLRGIVSNSGQRLEIDKKAGPKMMMGSTSLGTNGMYTDLYRGRNIANLKLGFHPLDWAFHILANLGDGGKEDLKKKKEAIAIILMFFFEGPRLVDVYELIKRALTEKTSIELGKNNQTQIGRWCDYSKAFYYEKGDTRRLDISAETSEYVRRVAHKFCIMCRSQWDKWMNDPDKKSSTSSSKD